MSPTEQISSITSMIEEKGGQLETSNDFDLEYCGSVQRASTSVGTSDLHKVQTETIAKLFKDIK